MSRNSLVILVADPDHVTSGTISEMLKVRGHAVTAVTTIVPGVRVIDTVLFDVLIVPVDKHHSMMDLTFLEIVKKKQPGIKIIGISSNVNESTSTSSAAVDVFLGKPFTLEQLEQVIRKITDDQAVA